MSERSGMLMLESPLPQLPDPSALVETRLTTQVLVAALLVFGIGRGGPKRQPVFPGYSGLVTPAAVQLRLLPVSVSVVAGEGRGPVGVSQLAVVTVELAGAGVTPGSG